MQKGRWKVDEIGGYHVNGMLYGSGEEGDKKQEGQRCKHKLMGRPNTRREINREI